MKRIRRSAVGSTVIAVTAAIGLGLTGAVDAAAVAALPMAQSRPSNSVLTLITGDRLTLHRGDRVAIEPGPGRDGVTFDVTHVGGNLHVVPSDAWSLIRAGRVDARLFDVTALLADGYDDMNRADLPLLVTQPFSGVPKAARAAAPVRPALPRGLRVSRDLPGIKGVAARVARADRANAWVAIRARGTAPAVPTVWLDRLYRPTLDVSVPQIGAPTAWAAGLTGAGVTVAVVDTGIDATHPDLAGKVVAQRTFVDGEPDADTVGHGTHIASTIAGTGAGSGGRFTGVAPDARLVDAKVCAQVCPVSAVIAGMEWAVAEQHATIVNVSLGAGDSPEVDPMEQAVHDLSDQYGALFVISAGNGGPGRTIETPGSAPEALTVGAVDSEDALAPFSSRGPTEASALKPDITAPGVDITAARSRDSDRPVMADRYTDLSGTSMATAHVTGAAAILAQRHPDWSGSRLKAALMASARPGPDIGVLGQGAGRVDVANAMTQTVTTSPASVNFGFQPWPHTDDVPATRTVTYHNAGPSAVTLDLAIEAAATFSVSPTRITVAAGGQTPVTVTADTRGPDPVGVLDGYLVATSGGSTTRTPFMVEKEDEKYDLDLTVTNRAGNPTGRHVVHIVGLDSFFSDFFDDPDGTVTARLPKGRYLVQANVIDTDPTAPFTVGAITALLQPVLDLRAPASVSLDARAARRVRVSIARPDATQHFGAITYALASPHIPRAISAVGGSFDRLFVGAVGGDIRLPGLSTVFNGQWARANPDGTVDDSPFTYNLSWEVRERAPNGLERHVRDTDLARVDATYLSQLPGGFGSKWPSGRFDDNWFGISAPTSFHMPFRRTEFYTAGPDIRWDAEFDEFGDSDAVFLHDLGRVYRPGHSYRETWNQPMYGPAFPAGFDPSTTRFARRLGDVILVGVGLFGDQFGHAGFRSASQASQVTLERDGVPVPGGGFFQVPPEAADYRLTQVDVAGASFALATTVGSEWRFRSEHAGNVALPLLAVRFHPNLDGSGSTPANRTLRVPVTVESQFGSSTTAIRSLTVDVSYDDGATWTGVPVEKDGHGAFVTLRHPIKPGFVALRASAADTVGNAVTQTIIRAYRIV
jgi:subtilisin family serine protease